MSKKLTIGELARRTGVPVKTLRYYSDEGLLPPSARSSSGYRLYSEKHAAVVELIRALREAGIGLDEIAKVLRRDLPLEDALRLRLSAVEAHVASLKQVASALRVALRSHASETDLRRIAMVTKWSTAERKKAVERFYEKVMTDSPVGEEWAKDMVAATLPDLPDDATGDQLDAWVELATLLDDPTFVESMREQAKNSWSPDVDQGRMRGAQGAAAKAAHEARSRGLGPESPEARSIAQAFFRAIREAGGTPRHDPRADRYWALVGRMKGQPQKSDGYDDWRWLGAALEHHHVR